MAYLVGFVVIALVIFNGRFRKFALLAAGLVVLLVWADYQHERSLDRAARSKIHVEDLRFDGLRLNRDYGGWAIAGRVANNSEYPLASIMIELTIKDCQPKDPSQCVVIGQDTMGWFNDIPPHQARDVSISFYPQPAPKPAGTVAWTYAVKEIEAKR